MNSIWVQLVLVGVLVLLNAAFAGSEMALVSLVARPVAMAAIWLASPFGLTAVAWSLIPANAANVLPLLVLVRRHVGVRWTELGRVALRSALVAGCAAMAPAGMVLLHGAAMGLPLAGLSATGAVIGWGVGLALARHPLGIEISRLGRPARCRAGGLGAR